MSAEYSSVYNLEKIQVFIYDVLDFTYKFNSIFRDSGYIEKRLAPQDFYLYLMDDNSGGRCYSLVRAMAVALALESR
ncbi:hypothetical protein J4727_03595 [Providencia rettgeri]|uniref:Uncharacterized protein n=1 Tax=Providencia rettgeri TaxID=587 RepID=A0A939NEX1_PRORE|nr:hypothetical protein [Providencia rettgeri]